MHDGEHFWLRFGDFRFHASDVLFGFGAFDLALEDDAFGDRFDGFWVCLFG